MCDADSCHYRRFEPCAWHTSTCDCSNGACREQAEVTQ
jgi:hypothetical protein